MRPITTVVASLIAGIAGGLLAQRLTPAPARTAGPSRRSAGFEDALGDVPVC